MSEKTEKLYNNEAFQNTIDIQDSRETVEMEDRTKLYSTSIAEDFNKSLVDTRGTLKDEKDINELNKNQSKKIECENIPINPKNINLSECHESGTEESIELENQNDTAAQDDLSNWKDKAQAGANSTLSIVQVGLLKEVLDGGPAVYQYYTLAIVLLTICIILEIFIGILLVTMFIYNSKKKIETKLTGSEKVTAENSKLKFNPTTRSFTSKMCCFCSDYSTLEENLIEKYKEYYKEEVESSLILANIKAEKIAMQEINVIEKLDFMDTNKIVDLDGDETVLKVLTKYKASKDRKMIISKTLNRLRKWSYHDISLKIQTILTYLFYILSVINIFVIAFCVSDRNPLPPEL